MQTDQVVEHFGGRRRVAEALGISTQAVAQWRERVPLQSAVQLEVLTQGRFRVDPDAYRRARDRA